MHEVMHMKGTEHCIFLRVMTKNMARIFLVFFRQLYMRIVFVFFYTILSKLSCPTLH